MERMSMKFSKASPFELHANPWNSNVVDRTNFEKLKTSMITLGCFKPVVVRELFDGKLQILGGYHRNEAAKELGWETVDYVNLGTIDDKKAKEIALIDNTRYGVDDEEKLQAILAEIGDLELIESIMPEDMLDLPEVEELDIEEATKEIEKEEETHKTLKFRLEIDKAEEVEAFLSRIAYDHDYHYRDGYADLAQALYHHIVLEKK